MLKFVWDERKRLRNHALHGFDFADAADFGWEDADVRVSYPSRLGRARFVATGPLGSRLVTIVFSPLGTEACSIISMRAASRKERKSYANR